MGKIIVGLFIGLFLFTVNVQAHCGKCGVGDAPKEDMGAMVGEKVEKMTKSLSLNDEQKGKVEGIIKAKIEKKHQIMEDHHKAMDALHEEFQANLKGVLTEEQMKKWETKKDDHGQCPMYKDGKKCKECEMKCKGKCPDCKDGKACEKCKGKKNKKSKDGHDHEHDHEHKK